MKIGIFDSGIGGLTVLKEVIKKYPNQEYVYFGDNKNIPYGSKSIVELKELVNQIMTFLIKQQVDIVIIACGTISSTLYSYLLNRYPLPIYDILSPTIEFINQSDYKHVGVIATPVTIKSKVLEKQIMKDIIGRECPLFVPLIESGKINSLEMKEAIDTYLQDLSNIDTLILGCTHYPLLTEQIKRILPKVELINMGTILTEILPITLHTKFKVNLYFSKVDNILIQSVASILDCPYSLKEV